MPRESPALKKDRIVDALAELTEQNNYPPTRPELAEATGYSLITVRRYVTMLIEEGRLVETPGHRTLRAR